MPDLLIQQLIEGALWLTFPDKAPLLNSALTHIYSLFSHVLWPIYVPIAVLLIVGGPLTWYLGSPLFITTRLVEAPPPVAVVPSPRNSGVD